jgi:putative addiction module component (TIGR02574 family)
MSQPIEKLESDLLKLDHRVRARLAHALLKSLDSLSPEENERLWLEEAERRAAEMRADPGMGIPVEQVVAEIRAKLAG